jgi:hypothetical protein
MSPETGWRDPVLWNRLLLGSAALGVAAIGVIYLFTPQTLLSVYEIDLRSASETNLYRSGYGGLFLAFAILFALGALETHHSRTAQLALLTFMGDSRSDDSSVSLLMAGPTRCSRLSLSSS